MIVSHLRRFDYLQSFGLIPESINIREESYRCFAIYLIAEKYLDSFISVFLFDWLRALKKI